jgi:hypothetical protein
MVRGTRSQRVTVLDAHYGRILDFEPSVIRDSSQHVNAVVARGGH